MILVEQTAMDQPKDVNQYKYDCLDQRMHWGMISEIDVTSVVMGKISEGNIVLNLGLRQEVLASYVIRVWNGFTINVDTSIRILESVKKKIDETGSRRRAFLVQASVDHLPLRGECVDVVISMLTTQGLLREEVLPLFQEFKRVLIKTGRFVLVEWVFELKSDVEYTLLELREIIGEKDEVGEYPFDYKEYCQILNRAGFEIEEIRFLPRRISLKRFDALREEKAIELLQNLDRMDSGQLQVNLALISSRVKR
jgi:SAM-dependent methyltransferase